MGTIIRSQAWFASWDGTMTTQEDWRLRNVIRSVTFRCGDLFMLRNMLRNHCNQALKFSILSLCYGSDGELWIIDHFRRKLPSFGWHSWAWRQLWSWSLRMFRWRWCQFDSFKSEHVYMKSNLSYASPMFIPFDKPYYLQDAYPTISIDPPFKRISKAT